MIDCPEMVHLCLGTLNYLADILFQCQKIELGFLGHSVVKNPPANAGLIPVLERSPGVGNINLLQYSCLENSKDRGTWWAMVHGGHKETDMIEQLSAEIFDKT